MRLPIQVAVVAIAVLGLALAGCRQRGPDQAMLAPRAPVVSPGLIRAPEAGAEAAGWEYARRDNDLGAARRHVPPRREAFMVWTDDRRYIRNGRVREYSRTITRSVRRGP